MRRSRDCYRNLGECSSRQIADRRSVSAIKMRRRLCNHRLDSVGHAYGDDQRSKQTTVFGDLSAMRPLYIFTLKKTLNAKL